MRGNKLSAVLFDMDGTLCETEAAWMSAEMALAARYGAEWSEAEGLALVGTDLLVSGAYIKERMNLPLSAAEVAETLVDGVVTSIADGVSWRPGAVQLLAACNEAGLPVGLVTMSYERFASAVVKALPAGRFDAVVTGDMVAHGKPAPDAYLLGAELLGVDAVSTVAIEDSPPGAASAEAAGCVVVAVPNHVDIPRSRSRVLLPTLAGVNPADLERIFSTVSAGRA